VVSRCGSPYGTLFVHARAGCFQRKGFVTKLLEIPEIGVCSLRTSYRTLMFQLRQNKNYIILSTSPTHNKAPPQGQDHNKAFLYPAPHRLVEN